MIFLKVMLYTDLCFEKTLAFVAQNVRRLKSSNDFWTWLHAILPVGTCLKQMTQMLNGCNLIHTHTHSLRFAILILLRVRWHLWQHSIGSVSIPADLFVLPFEFMFSAAKLTGRPHVPAGAVTVLTRMKRLSSVVIHFVVIFGLQFTEPFGFRFFVLINFPTLCLRDVSCTQLDVWLMLRECPAAWSLYQFVLDTQADWFSNWLPRFPHTHTFILRSNCRSSILNKDRTGLT